MSTDSKHSIEDIVNRNSNDATRRDELGISGDQSAEIMEWATRRQAKARTAMKMAAANSMDECRRGGCDAMDADAMDADAMDADAMDADAMDALRALSRIGVRRKRAVNSVDEC